MKTEGWKQVRDARGRKGGHHLTYEFALADGRILRTRISHPPDKIDYGASLFAHILRDQLLVSADEFWECVSNGTPPDRGQTPRPREAIPAEVAHLLESKVGLSSDEVSQLTKAEAIERLQRYWST